MTNNSSDNLAKVSYPIRAMAFSLAERLSCDLKPATGECATLLGACDIINITSHFMNYAFSCRGAKDEVSLLAENDDRLIFYYSGIQLVTKNSTEALIVFTPARRIILTYGIPKDVGVLEVGDRVASLAVQELSDVFEGMGGRQMVSLYDPRAPEPRPVMGVAQFRNLEQKASTLKNVLETLVRY